MWNRVFRLNYLELPHWAHVWVYVRLMYRLWRFHKSKHLSLSCWPCLLNGSRVHSILVIEIHIRLPTLWRLEGLARPKHLIQQSVLLLTPIRITPLHLQRLLGTGSVPLLVIADIGVALKIMVLLVLLIILFFLILDHIQFGIILCEVVLLLLYLT